MRLLVIRSKAELSVKGRSTVAISTGSSTIEKPLRDIDAVLIIGSNVRMSSSLPSVLASFNIPLAIMAKESIAIFINPVVTRYNNYRRLQYTLDKTRALEIALEYIKARVDGLSNILRYHKAHPPDIPKQPELSSDPEDFEYSIRLWESQVSNILWDKLILLLKTQVLNELKTMYGFLGRRPKHPDPFNKTLSVMYAVLYSLGTKALLAAGLDPTYGFLHRTRYSTPLTFDYIEMFKPVAVEATISMVNERLPELEEDGELKKDDVNKAIKTLYEYLTLKHKDTGKTIYQQIFLKAFCLAKYLEGKCRKEWLTTTWNRAQYRTRTETSKGF